MQLQDILFQQADTPVHKAFSVMDWLERNSIELVKHFPYSPDLNPIEYVWIERLHRQYPRIGDTPGGKAAVKKKLPQVLLLV